MGQIIVDLGYDFPRQVCEVRSRLETEDLKKTEGYRCHGKRLQRLECCSRLEIGHLLGNIVVHHWNLLWLLD
jgi:hypothetical protein